jgi:hypothetical protein
MVHWRVDRAVMRFRMTSEMSQKRVFAVFSGSVIALHKLCTSPMRPLRPRNYNDPRFLAKGRLGPPSAWQLHCEEAEIPSAASGGGKGGTLLRVEIMAIVTVALAACSSATPPPPADPQASAAIVKKDCSDPKWQEENLGLWYSVCRQPLRW